MVSDKKILGIMSFVNLLVLSTKSQTTTVSQVYTFHDEKFLR